MEKDRIHVYPLNDLKPHITRSEFCSCLPSVADAGYSVLVIHNSFDGREFFEKEKEQATKSPNGGSQGH